MRYQLFFTLLCGLFITSGCTANDTEMLENEFPPSLAGEIVINGTEYAMEQGGFEWRRQKGLETEVVQTDHASPLQIAAEIEAIEIHPNEIINIQVEENPDITMYLWSKNGRGKEIEQQNGQFTAPSDKGTYIYEVVAEWENGINTYTFTVEIQQR